MKLHERLAAIMSSRLDATARMVLVVIADSMSTGDTERPVWRSAATIAERSGLSRATVIETMKRLEACGVLTAEERVEGDPVRRRIDWPALAAADRPSSKRGSNPTARNGRGVRTPDTLSEHLTPKDEGGCQNIRPPLSEHLTPRVSEHLTGGSEDLTGGVRRPDPIRPCPSSEPPSSHPSSEPPRERAPDAVPAPSLPPEAPVSHARDVPPAAPPTPRWVIAPHISLDHHPALIAVAEARARGELIRGPLTIVRIAGVDDATARILLGLLRHVEPATACYPSPEVPDDQEPQPTPPDSPPPEAARAADPAGLSAHASDVGAGEYRALAPRRGGEDAPPATRRALVLTTGGPPVNADSPEVTEGTAQLTVAEPAQSTALVVAPTRKGKRAVAAIDDPNWHRAAAALGRILTAHTGRPTMLDPGKGRGETLAKAGPKAGWDRYCGRLEAVADAMEGRPQALATAARVAAHIADPGSPMTVDGLLWVEGKNLVHALDSAVSDPDNAERVGDVTALAVPRAAAMGSHPREALAQNTRASMDQRLSRLALVPNYTDVEVINGE